MARKWTEDDDIYLEYFAQCNDSSIEEAAEFLNRSKAAVVCRLTNLRKRNKNAVPCLKRKWTEKEDSILKQNYKIMSNAALAERLRRSAPAVAHRKKKLNLRVNKEITAHKEEIIDLINKGYYRPEIAKKLGIDLMPLTTFLLNNNIKCKDVPYEIRTQKMRETWF